MLVTRTNFTHALAEIRKHRYRSLDTETTGLFPFHGDRLFSIIIGTKDDAYYFNWNEYPGLPTDLLLEDAHKELLQACLLSDISSYWFMHKAIYDLPILAQDKLYPSGVIHCTKTGARIQYNEHYNYDLGTCVERIKLKKSKEVDDYIKAHKLYSHREYNGRKIKVKRFDLVPFEIITRYGLQDGTVTYKLGIHQIEQIEKRALRMPANKPNLKTLHENELRLEQTLHNMQMCGTRVDLDFCRRAVEDRQSLMDRSVSEFERITGRGFVLSAKCFSEVFVSEKDKWGKTKKGNDSFDADVLKRLTHPAAKPILDYKKAKAEIDFYHNFILYSDPNGDIHTDFNSGGTRTGRFSSSNPNLQNLKKDTGDSLDEEFVVRRAIVPRSGFFFAMLDYDQVEYRMMADYAGCTALIDKVLGGLDVHTATAEIANVTRDDAKTVNFGTLYGQGIAALASDLGVTESKARAIQSTIFNAAPEIKTFIRNVIRTAEKRGFIFNWAGRVCYFPKRNLCYKAPNTLIQGGAGDVVKFAMNVIDEYLDDKKSRMLLNIHDELVFEIAYDEVYVLPIIKGIMERIYPHKRLPLTVGIEWSDKSLADKRPWSEIDCLYEETGDKIQGKDLPAVEESAKELVRENSTSGDTGDTRLSGGC